MTNVGLVGAAHIHTPNFVKTMKARTDLRVTKVWDHDAERAARNAEALGAQVVPDPAEIWSDASIPAVVICSETDRHRGLVLAATAAKKHLFVEKPLGLGARDSWEMAAAVETTSSGITPSRRSPISTMRMT